MTVSYPRLAARTLRFTLGVPRNVTVSPDGRFVRFIRTPDGLTRTGQLWQYAVDTAQETLLVDPVDLLEGLYTGGLMGEPVTLVISDNQSTNETAQAQFERLIN